MEDKRDEYGLGSWLVLKLFYVEAAEFTPVPTRAEVPAVHAYPQQREGLKLLAGPWAQFGGK